MTISFGKAYDRHEISREEISALHDAAEGKVTICGWDEAYTALKAARVAIVKVLQEKVESQFLGRNVLFHDMDAQMERPIHEVVSSDTETISTGRIEKVSIGGYDCPIDVSFTIRRVCDGTIVKDVGEFSIFGFSE